MPTASGMLSPRFCLFVLISLYCFTPPSPSSACGNHGSAHAYSGAIADEYFTQFLELEALQTPPRTIKGKIKLNSKFYETSCSCADSALTSSCNPPFRLHVHQELINSEVGLTRNELKDRLGSPTAFQLREVEKMSFACIDGREPRAILGTPGGDFAEFLIALSHFETLTGSNFAQVEIKQYLTDWLMLAPAPMYYHTEEAARDLLARNLMINGVRGVVNLDLENPLAEQQAEMLIELPKAAYQGCYVLKAILATPGVFYLRKGLLESLIVSLYQILWDKQLPGPTGPLYQRIEFVISTGLPKERAWINFRSSHRCEDDKKAPLFAPRGVNSSQAQVYVNHPEAASVLRTILARFFLTRVPPLLITLPEFVGYINRHGLFVMETVAELLSNGKIPFYTVQVE